MIVSGLNGNRFLIGNKIPVKVQPDSGIFSQGSYITVTITKLITHTGDVEVTLPSIKLYPFGESLSFDLAPYIKGLMPYAYTPVDNNYNDYLGLIPNYKRFNISFYENQNNTSQTFLNKTFVRGFKRENSPQAFTLPINTTLSPVDKIPYWGSYPTARFYIDSNSYILVDTIANPTYFKLMPITANCNPFYVRFLNSLGGYSFWLFNAWEWNIKTKDNGVINRLLDRDSLGFSEENSIKVDTRVKREFFPLMKDLISSPMVQVYDKFTPEQWTKLDLKSSSFTENNYEDLIEFNCSFDLNLGNKPQVVW